jgi:hypothetical protein
VPPEYVTPLARFDGSVIAERTAREVSARCHDEQAKPPAGQGRQRRDRGAVAPGAASAILAMASGSYGVLYTVAGVWAMLGAVAILPVKGVR